MPLETTGWRRNNMPELPEVETVKRGLQEIYLNKTIEKVQVFYPKILSNIQENQFCEVLKNQTILSFDRKGKYIIIYLSDGTLLVHLRMEGKFKFSLNELDKHSHILFSFKDGSNLVYHDVRKFGRIWYFAKKINIFDVEPLNKLGPEPMEVSHPDEIYQKLQKINKPIKTALLDQSLLAGIGNIYADEICFACKIHPQRKANEITYEETKEILKQACRILNEAIKLGGSTIKSFQNAHGVDGRFQLKIQVYGKENQSCPICGHLIVKTFIHQRGTHFCPVCQKV